MLTQLKPNRSGVEDNGLHGYFGLHTWKVPLSRHFSTVIYVRPHIKGNLQVGINELLHWQWEGYARYHRTRLNPLLHIVVVPLFLVGNLMLVLALLKGSWAMAVGSAIAMAVSMALQGRGHRRESTPPEPFTGALNALLRIFLEQWVTFPRFVGSGGWLYALRHAHAA